MRAGFYLATVVSVSGTNPGLRAQHAYTIDVQLPPADDLPPSVMRVSGVSNAMGAWWDESIVDTKAAPPGALAQAYYSGGEAGYWLMFVRDGPNHGPC